MTADDSQENGGGAVTPTPTPINGGQDDSQEVLRHQTDAQIKAIESEIRENQPLTSIPLPVVHLVDLYAEGGAFQRGAQYLAEKYSTMRKVRGDGNCYYRAFLYSVCEKVLRGVLTGDDGAKKELERLTTLGAYFPLVVHLYKRLCHTFLIHSLVGQKLYVSRCLFVFSNDTSQRKGRWIR